MVIIVFNIVTDTASNLTGEMLKEKNISVLPLSFNIEGHSNICMDITGFDGHAYYDAIRAGAKVTTSQVTPQNYIDEFKPMLEAGNDVLFVGISSGVSGSNASAEIAARELREEYPERRIRVVDTRGASFGEGLFALLAADYRDQGMEVDEVAETLIAQRASMCQVFTVEDLKYLRATGRLSGIRALVGTLLQIKPLLIGDPAGKIVCFARTRGRKASIAKIAEIYDSEVVNPESQTVAIAHADCAEDAQALINLLNKNNPPKKILNVMYEPVTGSHVGPGALALFFMSTNDVRTRLAEG